MLIRANIKGTGTVNGRLAPLTTLTNWPTLKEKSNFCASHKPLTLSLAVNALNKSNTLTNGNLINEPKTRSQKRLATYWACPLCKFY